MGHIKCVSDWGPEMVTPGTLEGFMVTAAPASSDLAVLHEELVDSRRQYEAALEVLNRLVENFTAAEETTTGFPPTDSPQAAQKALSSFTDAEARFHSSLRRYSGSARPYARPIQPSTNPRRG
jgi:hypothetical protein